ncbi:hypothetical protein SAY86_009111 [Trapa natans]|uniref:HTH myb-type domain-containing protein n=1 Tax=Trapa natans TaxID=22666 RepID=A0AAN7KF94_TRANT|nr:hypothetical protein SAY86_009111 [Trapa natans]
MARWCLLDRKKTVNHNSSPSVYTYIFVSVFDELVISMEGSEQTKSYMEALEEERCKIQVFRRELPLCLDLVTRAIEMCKCQLRETACSMEETSGLIMSECLEKSSTEEGGAVLEFIPIKRGISSSDNHTDHGDLDHEDDSDEGTKSDWLKSVQLWNPNPEGDDPFEDSPPPTTRRRSELNGSNKTSTGAFQPIPVAGKSCLSSGEAAAAAPLAPEVATSTSSTVEKGGEDTGKREEKRTGPQSKKKQRRSWSVELHRLFVHALHQLGGPYVATPKQLKELMKVDDLTNDEIKSHLQKYRLHAKNSTRAISGNAQPSQFVVVRQIWVPPPPQPQYAAAVAAGDARGRDDAAQTRVLRPASQKIQQHMGSGSEGYAAHGISKSTTASASTHTVTVC